MNDAERKEKLLALHTKDLMKTKAGREVMWHILSMCNLYHSNPDGISFLEGRRSIGVEIIAMIEDVDPTSYGRLITEMHDASRRTDNNANKRRNATGFDPTDDGPEFGG